MLIKRNRVLITAAVLLLVLLEVQCEGDAKSGDEEKKSDVSGKGDSEKGNDDAKEEKTDSSSDASSNGEPQLVLDLCTVDQFKETLESDGFLSQLFKNHSKDLVDDMVKKYKEMDCKCGQPKGKWHKTEDKKVVLAAEGTTGTRWITQEFRTLCNVHINNVGHFVDEVAEGTDAIEQFTWISDTPVLANFCNIFWSHPNALMVQSLRDADEWAEKRKDFKPGNSKWQTTWSAALPCNDGENKKFGGENARGRMAAIDYAVMATFVKCVTPSERYVAINVFEGGDEKIRSTIKDSICPYTEGIEHTSHGGHRHHAGHHGGKHGHGNHGGGGGGKDVFHLGAHVRDVVHKIKGSAAKAWHAHGNDSGMGNSHEDGEGQEMAKGYAGENKKERMKNFFGDEGKDKYKTPGSKFANDGEKEEGKDGGEKDEKSHGESSTHEAESGSKSAEDTKSETKSEGKEEEKGKDKEEQKDEGVAKVSAERKAFDMGMPSSSEGSKGDTSKDEKKDDSKDEKKDDSKDEKKDNSKDEKKDDSKDEKKADSKDEKKDESQSETKSDGKASS